MLMFCFLFVLFVFLTLFNWYTCIGVKFPRLRKPCPSCLTWFCFNLAAERTQNSEQVKKKKKKNYKWHIKALLLHFLLMQSFKHQWLECIIMRHFKGRNSREQIWIQADSPLSVWEELGGGTLELQLVSSSESVSCNVNNFIIGQRKSKKVTCVLPAHTPLSILSLCYHIVQQHIVGV